MVVTGFDPLTSVNQINALFSSFGDIAEISNKTDPSTGSCLGVCLIRYRDSKGVRGGAPASASSAARKAYTECKSGQHRVGVRTVFVELDRDGSVGRRAIMKAIEKMRPRMQQIKERAEEPPLRKDTVDISGPPPTAPKGPSGRTSTRPGQIPPPPPPPEGPRAKLNLIEETPILAQIKRMPYVFLAHCYVPVLSTTIHHLKNRMRSYHWVDVRCDLTGYYVIFEDSAAGEEEAERCYRNCHMEQLFTYVMNLECQRWGNPKYERSPSPERVKAQLRRKAIEEKKRKEQEIEIEDEKQQRALNLDPVKGMLEILQKELREKLVEDVKSRIVGPKLFEYLDPDRHVEKRRKLNIADPRDSRRPGIQFERSDSTPLAGTPDARNEPIFSGGRKPLASSNWNVTALPRIRKGAMNKRENVGFTDERRAQRIPKKIGVRSLHHRLYQHQEDEEDSDDERRTSLTRDTEEQESRPMSRMSTVSPESDDEIEFVTSEQLQNNPKGGSLEEMGEEQGLVDRATMMTDIQDSSDAFMKTLEHNISNLPSTSRKRKRLVQELTARKKRKEDDELFGVVKDEGLNEQAVRTTVRESPTAETETVVDENASEPLEREAEHKRAQVKKPKPKKKTKKQVFEEREAAKKEQAKVEIERMLAAAPKAVDIKPDIEPKSEPNEIDIPTPAEIDWAFSRDKPRRTVEEDSDVVLDIDGWQHIIKDDEDLMYLRQALTHRPAARIKNITTWAWKQKEIKALNRNGERGIVRAETVIDGYYVPNPSGCARTEGVKKILESEKSKYLLIASRFKKLGKKGRRRRRTILVQLPRRLPKSLLLKLHRSQPQGLIAQIIVANTLTSKLRSKFWQPLMVRVTLYASISSRRGKSPLNLPARLFTTGVCMQWKTLPLTT